MGYNPADYAAIQAKAKAMSKQELEDLYVKKRDEKHLHPAELIGIVIVTAVIVFMVYLFGYSLAADNISENMYDVKVQIADDVCPIVSDAYIDVDLKGLAYDISIDCLDYRER